VLVVLGRLNHGQNLDQSKKLTNILLLLLIMTPGWFPPEPGGGDLVVDFGVVDAVVVVHVCAVVGVPVPVQYATIIKSKAKPVSVPLRSVLNRIQRLSE